MNTLHDPVDSAEDAVRLLQVALDAAGITLPNLKVDGCTCGHITALTTPLVELGCVRPDVAARLAGLVANGAIPHDQ